MTTEQIIQNLHDQALKLQKQGEHDKAEVLKTLAKGGVYGDSK